MRGGEQSCGFLQSSSPGVPLSGRYTQREGNKAINKKRPRRGARSVASAALVAGTTVVALMTAVGTGKMSGAFAHGREVVAGARRRSLRPLSKDNSYAPLDEGDPSAARRILKTEGEWGIFSR